jgi:precorrin-6B methylase 2
MKPRFISMRGSVALTQGLLDLISYINNLAPTKDMRLLEIGAYTGESTSIFCRHFKSVTIIDPYTDGGKHASGDEVLDAFCFRMKEHTNYTLIRKTSDNAFKDVIDEQFDVVYLDGNHDYHYVKRDILNYQTLVKPNGFITGHDYKNGWVGVEKAVDECLGNPQIRFMDASWLVRKSGEKQ